jgi:hypothetical protein
MARLRLLFCFFALFVVASRALLDLTLFSAQTAAESGARCLDGSPAGYYIEVGSVPNKWVISLQGGGLCIEVDECKSRLNNSLGSSAYFEATYDGIDQTYGGRSDYAVEINPGFWNWTRVHVPYCNGDLWSGTRTSIESTYGVYFSGHLTVKAVIEDLISKHSLNEADELIFAGGSAGALGATANIDWVNQRLPGVTISVLLNAGWFIPYYPPFTSATPPLEDLIRNASTYYQSRLNQDCVAAHPGNTSICTFPEIAYSYIPNRLFVLQSVIDNTLAGYLGLQLIPDKITEVGLWTIGLGGAVQSSLQNHVVSRYGSGGVITTCFIHGLPWTDVKFQVLGHSSAYYAMNWYYNLPEPQFAWDGCDVTSAITLLLTNVSLVEDCNELMAQCYKGEDVFPAPPLAPLAPVAPQASPVAGPSVLGSPISTVPQTSQAQVLNAAVLLVSAIFLILLY